MDGSRCELAELRLIDDYSVIGCQAYNGQLMEAPEKSLQRRSERREVRKKLERPSYYPERARERERERECGQASCMVGGFAAARG